MKIPKRLTVGTLVVVRWIDAFALGHISWLDVDEIDRSPMYHVDSCGYVVGADKKYITIAGDMGDCDAWGRVFNIPWGCVEKVMKVNNGKK